MRVFLDVGAHNGQTLEEVLKAEHEFQRVWAFEPMPSQYDALLARFDDDRVVFCNYGLSDATSARTLYGSNEAMEASLYSDKVDVDKAVTTECSFVEASWFAEAHLFDTDVNVMKLNCEGSEAGILDNLINSGEIRKLSAVMVDFDVRKIPSQRHREAEVLARLREIGFDRYSLCENVMLGETHQDRIAHWLRGLS